MQNKSLLIIDIDGLLQMPDKLLATADKNKLVKLRGKLLHNTILDKKDRELLEKHSLLLA
jgi:hypothetical protein